jgi:hypothetical protein
MGSYRERARRRPEFISAQTIGSLVGTYGHAGWGHDIDVVNGSSRWPTGRGFPPVFKRWGIVEPDVGCIGLRWSTIDGGWTRTGTKSDRRRTIATSGSSDTTADAGSERRADGADILWEPGRERMLGFAIVEHGDNGAPLGT